MPMLYLIKTDKYISKNKAQLWDQDRRTFFWWIASFMVGLVVIISVLLAAIGILSADRAVIIEAIKTSLETTGRPPANPGDEATRQWGIGLGTQVVYLAIFVTALISLALSFQKSLKKKSFAALSMMPTAIVFVMSVSSFVDFIVATFNGISIADSLKISSFYIISLFVIKIVYLLVWFFVSRNVALIRRIFLKVEFDEHRSRFFQNADVFTSGTASAATGFNAAATSANPAAARSEGNGTDPTYQRLEALDKKQLDQIAKQLSISGYETMARAELIKVIYGIYKAMQVSQDGTEQTVEPRGATDANPAARPPEDNPRA